VANGRVNGLGEAQGLYLHLYTLKTDWSPAVIERVDGLGWTCRANLQRGHTTQTTSFQKTHKFRTFSYRLSLTEFTVQRVCNPPYPPLLQPYEYILKVLWLSFLAFAFAVTNMWNSEFTIRNANKGQLLKPEQRGWRWTGLYPRATHQGTPSYKTNFLRESSVNPNNLP